MLLMAHSTPLPGTIWYSDIVISSECLTAALSLEVGFRISCPHISLPELMIA
ncbi:hypothetical protein ACHAXM_007714 [Skeletonema potamos]